MTYEEAIDFAEKNPMFGVLRKDCHALQLNEIGMDLYATIYDENGWPRFDPCAYKFGKPNLVATIKFPELPGGNNIAIVKDAIACKILKNCAKGLWAVKGKGFFKSEGRAKRYKKYFKVEDDFRIVTESFVHGMENAIEERQRNDFERKNLQRFEDVFGDGKKDDAACCVMRYRFNENVLVYLNIGNEDDPPIKIKAYDWKLKNIDVNELIKLEKKGVAKTDFDNHSLEATFHGFEHAKEIRDMFLRPKGGTNP